MRIVAFIEELQVVHAILEHVSLWAEARPSTVMPDAAALAPVELEYSPFMQ
jgi:hypothetical protein